MCEKHVGQCFVLRALHRLPSHSSVFKFCFPCFDFFFWRYLKWKLLVCVNMVKNISNFFCFFCFVQCQKCSKYFRSFTGLYFFYTSSMDTNLVADWWWTVWFDILFTFSQLLNLNSRCKIHGTKCLQRTIALYQYKMFNLFPFELGILYFSRDMRNLR